MRIVLAITALVLACLAVPGSAGRRDPGAEPPECTAKNSQAVTLADMWANGRRLRGTCVALKGYRAYDVIFTDQVAYYAYTASTSPQRRGVIGIPYPGFRGGEKGWMRGTYYGRVILCSDDRKAYRRTLNAIDDAAKSGEIVLVHLYGYCATSQGPAVAISNADEAPASDLIRLTGEDLRRSLGELVEPDQRYLYAATLSWLAEVATEGGCQSGFQPGAAPTGPPQGIGVPLWRPRDDARRNRALALWCNGKPRQTVTYLLSRTSPSAYERGVALDMVHCLCTSADCAGRWPVALVDTGWDTARPYFCQRIKLRPRTETGSGDRITAYADFAYEFSDDYIANGAPGFPERAGAVIPVDKPPRT